MKWTAPIVLLFAGIVSAQAPDKSPATASKRPLKE